jgi:rhodanese-related sulfurtransferase
MPTFRQLLEQARAAVPEVSPESVAARLRSDDAPVLLDVREPDETAEGHVPGALLVPRGNLELRVERMVDREREVVVYCASGVRSVLSARTLLDLGYARVSSLAGGYGRWSDLGLPVVRPTHLRADQKARYRRHLSLPEVGE